MFFKLKILTVTEHMQSKMASLGSDLTSLQWTFLLFTMRDITMVS